MVMIDGIKMLYKLDVSKIKWIFFDVGSTLVDEQVAYDHRALDMLQSTNITFAEFANKRVELSRQGYDGNSAAISYYGLNRTPWHFEDERLFPASKEILHYLKSKGYFLGVIANQANGLGDRLKQFGIFDYFDMVVASEEMGVCKPDYKIFLYALEKTNCSPLHAIMVGDRLDNDIIPAKSVGMNTIWIRHGLAIYQDVTLGNDIADIVIDDLQCVKSIF